MMQWFHRLTQQEQRLIKIGAVLISIAIAWAFIYRPLSQNIAAKQRQKATLTQQYQQMQEAKPQFEAQKKTAVNFQRDVNKPFISWIDEQLEKRQLTQFVTRSEPKDNQTVTISFESVAFDDLANWLQPLSQNFGVSITEADINVTDRSTGLCNARLTLEESP